MESTFRMELDKTLGVESTLRPGIHFQAGVANKTLTLESTCRPQLPVRFPIDDSSVDGCTSGVEVNVVGAATSLTTGYHYGPSADLLVLVYRLLHTVTYTPLFKSQLD